MIELRWLKVPQEDADRCFFPDSAVTRIYPLSAKSWRDEKMVLQYRHHTTTRDIVLDKDWTEWQDVPVVEEE
jgi:hypothetical protein